MAGRITRDLYLQVGGNVAGLQTASKAGKSALLELGNAAVDVQDVVDRAFADMAANAPASAAALERSYTQTFNAIRSNAQAVLKAPSQGSALQILDAGAADQAAAAAEMQAAALRQVATAAASVAQRAGEAGAAERVLAVASAANATQAEQEAVALRNQANVLGAVRGELETMGVVQKGAVVRNEQHRQSVMMLGQQAQDFSVQVVSGQSVVTAFSQQIGQAAFAVQGMGGKMEAVAGFLTSGWGIAATVALTVLAPLVSKVLEHKDALEDETKQLKENAEKAAVADQAKQAFARTEAGVIDDVRALTDEIKKQNDALLTNAERLNVRSKKRLEALGEAREDVQTKLITARTTLTNIEQNAPERKGDTGYVTRLGVARGEVTALETRLARIGGAINSANAARLASARDMAGEAAKRAGDPIEEIRRRYEGPNGLIEVKKREATADEVMNGTLYRRLTLLGEQQRRETDIAQKKAAAARATPNNNQIGREVTVAEATAIAASIGGNVTSGLRSPEKQQQIWNDKLAGRHVGPVARPGTSDHERGQAIDIAYGPGISESSIREAFAKQGVRIRQLLNEPTQRVFHVAFGAKGKSQEAIARAEDAAVQKRARDQEAYDQLLLRAQEEAVQLRRGQVVDIAAAADLDVKAVQIARERLDSAADAGVAQKRWSQAKADELKAVYQSNAAAKTSAVRDVQAQRMLDEQLEADREALSASSALLNIQSDLAVTNADRKRIALQLLANDEAAARVQAKRLMGSDKPADWAKGEAMNRQIDAEHGGRAEQVDRQFAGPWERYSQQMKAATADTSAALEDVAVRGFGAIEDGAVSATGQAITKLLKLKGVAGEVVSQIITDLARLATQKLLMQLLPGVGSFLGFATGGKVEGKATGGRITGAGTGTSDSIFALVDGIDPLMVSNGESIVTAAATSQWWPIIDAMNKGTFRLPGLATGGAVGSVRMPRLPDIGEARSAVAAADAARNPGVSIPITIDARGADQAAVARLDESLRQLRSDLPGMVLSTYADAKTRRVI
jgi:hypothetical protein